MPQAQSRTVFPMMRTRSVPGSWASAMPGASWPQRFDDALASPADATIHWRTANGLQHDSLAPVSDGILRLGLMCEAASDSPTTNVANHELCDRARPAIGLLNDKADGFFDELLPNYTIVAHAVTVELG